MAQFHDLIVSDITRLTREAVSVTLRPEDPALFRFTQGQYLTFRKEFGGVELRRCYSISSAPGDSLRVGIKQVDGGVFSTWANRALKPGDRLHAMAPMGGFFAAPEAEGGQVLCVAGGSGITPILSILRAGLEEDHGRRFTLIYANRNPGSIMFRGEISDLKDRYLTRFNVMHILEDGAEDAIILNGRLDAEKCAALFQGMISPHDVAMAFVCGPAPMMETVEAGLGAAGLPPERIRIERFTGQQTGRAPKPADSAASAGAEVTARVTLEGQTWEFSMPGDRSLLEAALVEKLGAPFACRAGVCSTCKARVVEGEVQMRANHALEDYEVEKGYVLTCQSYPVSPKVVWDYDQSGH